MTTTKTQVNIREVNQAVGEKVKERRLSLGLSRAEIADLVGVSQQQFEKYEKGLNRISAGMLAAIASSLQVEPAYFFQEVILNTPKATSSHQRLALELSRNFLNIENPQHRRLVMIATNILSERNNN